MNEPFVVAAGQASTAVNRHNAPPVSYPLERSLFLGACLLGLWLAGFFSMLLVLQRIRHLDWRLALALICVVVAGLAARRSWKNMLAGRLAWDGEVWRFERLGHPTDVDPYTLGVVADFQGRLLLRLENQAHASVWLWLERDTMPERWLDLRRAVYSPHKSVDALPRHDFLADAPSSLPSQSQALPPSNLSMIRGQSHEV